MTKVTRQQILHLAQLAHLELSEAEVERIADEVAQILTSVAQVQQVATPQVEPTSHPIALTNVFRDDVVGEILTQQQAVSGAPDAAAGRFKVPAMFDSKDAR